MSPHGVCVCVCVRAEKKSGVHTQRWLCKWETEWLGPSHSTCARATIWTTSSLTAGSFVFDQTTLTLTQNQ